MDSLWIHIMFNWEDVLNLINVSYFENNLKFTFKSWLLAFIFGWPDRAGCKESGSVNIIEYF